MKTIQEPAQALTYLRKYRNYGNMKTTLILRDDLVRRAKARAALRGQSLSRYVEDCLERTLREEEGAPVTAREWIQELPSVSRQSARELKGILETEAFRTIDVGMWE